jgi:hypothetical protein
MIQRDLFQIASTSFISDSMALVLAALRHVETVVLMSEASFCVNCF